MDLQLTSLAFALALDNAGNSIAANIAIIAITTKSSIKVNRRETSINLLLRWEKKAIWFHKHLACQAVHIHTMNAMQKKTAQLSGAIRTISVQKKRLIAMKRHIQQSTCFVVKE